MLLEHAFRCLRLSPIRFVRISTLERHSGIVRVAAKHRKTLRIVQDGLDFIPISVVSTAHTAQIPQFQRIGEASPFVGIGIVHLVKRGISAGGLAGKDDIRAVKVTDDISENLLLRFKCRIPLLIVSERLGIRYVTKYGDQLCHLPAFHHKADSMIKFVSLRYRKIYHVMSIRSTAGIIVPCRLGVSVCDKIEMLWKKIGSNMLLAFMLPKFILVGSVLILSKSFVQPAAKTATSTAAAIICMCLTVCFISEFQFEIDTNGPVHRE